VTENKSYKTENKQGREKLRTLVTRLGDGELTLQLPNGWTISEALVHLAFWDLRQLAVLKQWISKGVQPMPIDSRTVNDAVSVIAKSIAPRVAVSLVLEAAETIDRELEKITPAFAAEILKQGHERMLNRALHRREHLDKIENVLNAKK
jgi:hypothetical protein